MLVSCLITVFKFDVTNSFEVASLISAIIMLVNPFIIYSVCVDRVPEWRCVQLSAHYHAVQSNQL